VSSVSSLSLSTRPPFVEHALSTYSSPFFSFLPFSLSLSISSQSPSYTGFFVTTSLLSFLAFVPWFAAGSLHRLLLHAPKVMDLSPYTTWTTMRAPDAKALFGRKTGLLLGPIDLLVVQTTDSRLALGELADKFRWKPFRAGVGRMWLGMFRYVAHVLRDISLVGGERGTQPRKLTSFFSLFPRLFFGTTVIEILITSTRVLPCFGYPVSLRRLLSLRSEEERNTKRERVELIFFLPFPLSPRLLPFTLLRILTLTDFRLPRLRLLQQGRQRRDRRSLPLHSYVFSSFS